MRTILVDDEKVILEDLRLMLKDKKNIEVVGTYTDSDKAIQELHITKPHCAFLDIEMTDTSGIQLAEKLLKKNPEIEVLFITAHNHYATQAFEVNAIDYVLKPVRPERLEKALDKVYRKWKLKEPLSFLSLKIQSFGMFEVFVGNKPVKWCRSKPRELFAYLLQNEGKWVEKYRICDDLWREHKPEQALSNLQTAIWAIRKTMNRSGCTQVEISYSQDRYMLKVYEADWDLQQFNRAFKEFTANTFVDMGRKAEKLYGGEYLKGEDWPWSDIERESYRFRYKELKHKLDRITEK